MVDWSPLTFFTTPIFFSCGHISLTTAEKGTFFFKDLCYYVGLIWIIHDNLPSLNLNHNFKSLLCRPSLRLAQICSRLHLLRRQRSKENEVWGQPRQKRKIMRLHFNTQASHGDGHLILSCAEGISGMIVACCWFWELLCDPIWKIKLKELWVWLKW
jgi:hypothetical protein